MPEAKYPKIHVTPPGPKARAILARDEKIITGSVVRFYPLVIESGKDCIVRDVDGNEYIDFNSGLLCLNVGHCHPLITEAVKTQSERFLHYSYTDFYYEKLVDLGEKLQKLAPGSFPKKIFYSNSGAESIESAIKAAKWHTRKQLFFSFTGAFHGRTMGAVSLTASKPTQKKHFFPLMPGVIHVPYAYCYRCPYKLTYPDCDYWCVDFIDEWVFKKYAPPEDVAAFFFEPIQGEGGYVVPPPEYFQKLKKLTDKYGILLADDEIQTGVGRTGKFCAIEHWNITPDIVCMAKSIAAGLPLGVTIARAEVMDWEGGSHANTFGGNPLACSAAKAVIDVIEKERLMENATRQGAHMMTRLKEMQEKYPIIGDVRGKGLMIGVEIVKDKKTKAPGNDEASEIMQKSWRRGVAVITCGPSTIRIAPPLTITRELVDSALDVIEGVVKEVSR
jgi:4-aminobutyrate aminotransferase